MAKLTKYVRLSSHIMRNRLGLSGNPCFVTFFVTLRCNHKCVMCDVWGKKPSDEMSLEEVENIFRQLKFLDAVRLSGGEPFLRKDLSEIVNIIQKHSNPLLIHITTNGFLTDAIGATLTRINDLTRVHLKISIDAVGINNDRIRGLPGAYERALNSLAILGEFKKKGLFVAVNQTISDKSSIEDSAELKRVCNKHKVPLLMQIAYNDSVLYGSKNDVSAMPDKKGSFSPFYNFSEQELRFVLDKMLSEAKETASLPERLVKKYYVHGLINRMLHGKAHPNPACVALRSHLRILPDGLVPVCLYDSTIVGDLKKQSVREVLTSDKAREAIVRVKKCKGCWAECEAVPNGIYRADFLRALFY
ncbi:MAG: radical SAM protein [Candidatus Omnitrophota bacterium]|nr:radical SAM protein [Candidatus Omnitrophota bacterium]